MISAPNQKLLTSITPKNADSAYNLAKAALPQANSRNGQLTENFHLELELLRLIRDLTFVAAGIFEREIPEN